MVVVAAVIAVRVRLAVVAAVIAARVLLAVVVVVVIVIVIWVARRGPDGSSTDSGGAQAWAVSAIISATVGAAAIRYGTAAIRYTAASPYGTAAIRYPAASCYGASTSCARCKGFSRNTHDPECGDRSEGNSSTI